MIVGIGTDIVETNRIQKAINKNSRFIAKVFTKEEIKYFEQRKYNIQTISGMFAAKEAISKALGTGVRGFSLHDIEVLHDELNKPIVRLSSYVEQKYKLVNYKFHLTISHSDNNAIAFAILEE